MIRVVLCAAAVAFVAGACSSAGEHRAQEPSPSADTLYFPVHLDPVAVVDDRTACQAWGELASTYNRSGFIDDLVPLLRLAAGQAPNIRGDNSSESDSPYFSLNTWASAHGGDSVAAAWETLQQDTMDSNLGAVYQDSKVVTQACRGVQAAS